MRKQGMANRFESERHPRMNDRNYSILIDKMVNGYLLKGKLTVYNLTLSEKKFLSKMVYSKFQSNLWPTWDSPDNWYFSESGFNHRHQYRYGYPDVVRKGRYGVRDMNVAWLKKEFFQDFKAAWEDSSKRRRGFVVSVPGWGSFE